MCIRVHVCMCVCVRVRAHACTCMRVRACAYVRVRVRACVRGHVVQAAIQQHEAAQQEFLSRLLFMIGTFIALCLIFFP